jgi:8-oxo-dGTP pyrophosphatase MutT (NUDIX family)
MVPDTPHVFKLILNFESNTITSMKNIELAYWDYLDNYHAVNKRAYPSFSFKKFVEAILYKHGLSLNVKNLLSVYDKYKKKIPTAGCIFYYKDSTDLYIATVLIRQYGISPNRMFSMPKGKKEPEDIDLIATAVRETREETGLDISSYITDCTTKVTIVNTTFFVIESDHKVDFKNHSNREIEQVKWASKSDILRNPDIYSRQVRETLQYLIQTNVDY